jgi:hypothetical protein
MYSDDEGEGDHTSVISIDTPADANYDPRDNANLWKRLMIYHPNVLSDPEFDHLHYRVNRYPLPSAEIIAHQCGLAADDFISKPIITHRNWNSNPDATPAGIRIFDSWISSGHMPSHVRYHADQWPNFKDVDAAIYIRKLLSTQNHEGFFL